MLSDIMPQKLIEWVDCRNMERHTLKIYSLNYKVAFSKDDNYPNERMVKRSHYSWE
jgi:hypothetical protein